jgi:multicomponent K+:H+ antiporter subunit G
MIWEILISALLVVSGVFGFVGSFGLIKLPDTMSRLHAPTKATTLGVGGVLIASMVYFAVVLGEFSFHEILITIFLFLTAPISAHFVAKAHIHSARLRDELPETGTGSVWAVCRTEGELPPDEQAARASETAD